MWVNRSGPRTRTRSRRQFLGDTGAVGLGAGLATSGLASCGSDQPAERVTLVRYEDATAAPIWEKVLRAFRAQHPGIDVEYKNIAASSWAEFFDTVSVQIAGGQVPDVIQVASEGQRLFAGRGLVEPIDDLIERDRQELAPYFDEVHPNLVSWMIGRAHV